MPNPRPFHALLYSLVAIAAMGQQPFEFNYAEPGRDVMINDMEWVDGGAVLVGTSTGPALAMPYQATLFTATTDGALVTERRLAAAAHHIQVASILSASDNRLHVLGPYLMHPDSFAGFFHYGLNMQGVVLDSSFIAAGGARKSYLENATLYGPDRIVLAGSVAYTTNYVGYSHAHIMRLNLNGGQPQWLNFGTTALQAMLMMRDLVPFGDGLLGSSERWPMLPGMYTIISPNLSVEENWFGQSLSHDLLNPSDSVLRGPMTILPLDGHRFFVGGSFLSTSPRYSVAVYLADTTATTLKTFVPHGPYQHEMAAMQQCIARIDEQTFYFQAVENVQFLGSNPPFTPSAPNRLHVYKLDTALNLLCDYVIDGTVTSTYYWANRIKATPDGGFVIMGAKKDMSVPGNQFTAWAQRFSAGDCTVGIGTVEASRHATVFPNPGRNGFEVLLNGSGLTKGKLALFDATGTLVGESSLAGNHAYMDCSHLAYGLYLYRITDGRGQPYAAGRWLKQP